MKNRLHLFLLLPLLWGYGCTTTQPIRLRIAAGSSYASIAQSLITLWKQELSLDVELITPGGGVQNCQAMLNGKADLALTHNDMPIEECSSTASIRTVLPLFRQILFITCRSSIRASSLRELVVGRRVCIGMPHSGTSHLALHLLQSLDINTTDFTLITPENPDANTVSDSIEVSFNVTAFNSSRIATMLAQNKAKLFSLDDAERINKGSSADAFCLHYYHAQPYIIPRNTYGTHPERPCLTVAVDNVLLCRSNLDAALVKALAKTILEHRSTLANTNTALAAISERFDASLLTFPLHDGMRMYLERNEPSFVERYSSVLGLFLSISVALAGGFSGFLQWNKRRKKNRIDVYYLEVLAVREQVTSYNNSAECRQALGTLERLQTTAFNQLVAEKLIADESFRIFINLLQQTSELVREKEQQLKRPILYS